MGLDFQREDRLRWPLGLISTQTGLKHEKRFFFFLQCVLLLFYQKADFKSIVN